MNKLVVVERRKADMYRDRAEELRVLAEQLQNQEHRRLLLESADNYDKLAELAEKRATAQFAYRWAAS